MSQKENKKKEDGPKKDIDSEDKNKHHSNDDIVLKKVNTSFISGQNENIGEEKIAEDFDFLQDNSKALYNFDGVEKCFDDIKENKDKNLDEYIKDSILILEEFSCILNFEDLIIDPAYTFKLFMKSLKKVIDFKYFCQKFIIPKVKEEMPSYEIKNESKEDGKFNKESNKKKEEKGSKKENEDNKDKKLKSKKKNSF